MALSRDSVLRILDAMTDRRVLALQKEYHADASDGIQWMFFATQGESEKSAYFNNHFPSEIVRFTDAMDDTLSKDGVSSVKWLPVSYAEAAQIQKQFRDSIKK